MTYTAAISFLRSNATGNEFYSSLVAQYDRRGDLSEKQWACVARAMTPKPAATELDVSRIEELFRAAKDAGLKRPAFRAEGVEISEASASSRNVGALYVKADGVYQGKVMGGRFMPVRDVEENTAAALLAVAADPRAAAVRYGRLTGHCACCGRELTDPESVARGVGPICEARWGL